MDLESFWKILYLVRASSGVVAETRVGALRERLRALTDDQIVGFARQLESQLRTLDRPDVRAAADLMCGPCDDQQFRAFRCWLLSEGQNMVAAALADPDALAALLYRDTFQLATYGDVAAALYRERKQAELPTPAVDVDEIAFEQARVEPGSIRLPRLARKYGQRLAAGETASP